jgi:WD40 repeat protein
LDDGTVLVIRVADRAVLHSLISAVPLVHALAFSPDGTTLAIGTWDGHEQLWDPRTAHLAGPRG